MKNLKRATKVKQSVLEEVESEGLWKPIEVEDENINDEILYCSCVDMFNHRSVKQRNDDFYDSQKNENLELEKLLDLIYG